MIWAVLSWGAIGGWVEDGYACAWFGQEAGTPPVGAPEPQPEPAGATTCPWGPNQCKQGYVWRVSRPDDLVCVTPEVREQTADDNAERRRAGPTARRGTHSAPTRASQATSGG